MVQHAILDKVVRYCEQLGLTINTRSTTSCVVENDSNDLTITLNPPDILAPMGGVSPDNSPFLGIGKANPAVFKVKSATSTSGDVTDVIDSLVAVKVLRALFGFANDVTLENGDASFTVTLRGHTDWIGLGQ